MTKIKSLSRGKKLPSYIRESALNLLHKGLLIPETRKQIIVVLFFLKILNVALYQGKCFIHFPLFVKYPEFQCISEGCQYMLIHKLICEVLNSLSLLFLNYRHHRVDVMDHLLRQHPEMTAEQLQKVLAQDFGVSVTMQHISRVRQKLGWTTKRVKYYQLISNKNKHAPVEWCLQALSLKDDFFNVIFTDKTSTEMSSSGRIFLNKKKSEFDRLPGKTAKPKHPYKVFSFILLEIYFCYSWLYFFKVNFLNT